MNVNDAIDFKRMLEQYFPRGHYALGGYPSLVTQGILKEERETNDLDIVQFGKTNVEAALSHSIRSAISEFMAKCYDKNVIIDGFSIDHKEIVSSHELPEISSMEELRDIISQRSELAKLGINRSYSISISRYNKKQKKSSIENTYTINSGTTSYSYIVNDMDYLSGEIIRPPKKDLFLENIMDLKEYIPRNDLSEGFNDMCKMLFSIKSNKAELALSVNVVVIDYLVSILLETTKIDKIQNDTLRLSDAEGLLRLINRQLDRLLSNSKTVHAQYGESATMLSVSVYDILNQYSKDLDIFIRTKKEESEKFIRQHINSKIDRNILNFSNKFNETGVKQLKIDIFAMNPIKLNKVSIIHDNQRFVHYYPILKAKYEYCKNTATGEESFSKHIKDLELSFNKKRIFGVNDPQSIDWLIKNRLEAHESKQV